MSVQERQVQAEEDDPRADGLTARETIDATEPVSGELAGSARSVRSIDEGAG